MSNPSKAKGTAAETALLRYAHQHGFPHADRQPLRGNRDQGDLALCPGVVVEVKNHSGMPALGQPSAAVLAQWMNQTEVERTNARAAIGLLVVKRKGTTDPGRWFAYLPLTALTGLVSFEQPAHPGADDIPVCMSVADAVTVLRGHGYGQPLEVA